jgi:hypothetical protein
VFPSNSEIDGQVASKFPIVLDIERIVIVAQTDLAGFRRRPSGLEKQEMPLFVGPKFT